MKRTIGIALALVLLAGSVSPCFVLAQPPPEEKEAMTSLVEGVVENILVPPEGAARSGCPYTPLNACLSCCFAPLNPLSGALSQIIFVVLNFILPPLDPLISVLPSFLDYLMGTVKAIIPLLQDPELLGALLPIALPIILQNPYSIIHLLDMILNPYSLGICNPLTFDDMGRICGSLFYELSPGDCPSDPGTFSQAFIMNCSAVCAAWLSGLRGVLGIIPGIIPVLEPMKEYL